MTRWTPELLDQIRALAAQGWTKLQIAQELGLSYGTLRARAGEAGIRFHGKTWDNRKARRAGQIAPSRPVVQADLRQAASEELARQIALARAEATTAPLYRGGWPT